MIKIKCFIINFIYIMLDLSIRVAILSWLIISLINVSFFVYLLATLIIRLVLFRLYTVYNLVKYLKQFNYSEYNIMKFSISTKLWYLDDLYLKGIVIIPISQNINNIVCSTSVHYQPFGPKKSIQDTSYPLFYVYDKVISSFLELHPIRWDFRENIILTTTMQTVKISKDHGYRLVKSNLLKLSYENKFIEYQRDTVNDVYSSTRIMDALYK